MTGSSMLDPSRRMRTTATGTLALPTTVLSERGPAGLPIARLVTRLGVQPAETASVVERLVAARAAIVAGETLLAPAVADTLSRQVLELLGGYHRVEALSEGMPREEIRERLFSKAGEGVFDCVLGGLAARGAVAGRERVALASHRVALSGEEERAREAIERMYREGGLKPPEPAAVASASGLARDVAERVTHLLVRQKVLVKLDTLLFHEQALGQLKRDMAAQKEGAGPAPARIDVATFKERYGVSRKYAIPLLEYLDRERITRRVGDARVLL